MSSKLNKSAKSVNAAVSSVVETPAPASSPFAYVAPTLGHPKAFTVWHNAFAGVEAIVAARKAEARLKNDGTDPTRAGFQRELWVDAESRDGHPVIVVRSKDHTTLGGRSDAPEKAATCYCDVAGNARPIEVAHFVKGDEEKARAVAAELVAFYRAGDADNRETPLANRFALVKSAEAVALIALLSSHFASPQRVGHHALRQAKAASRVTKTATKGVADAKSLLADAQDAELAKALALVEKALAARAGAAAAK